MLSLLAKWLARKTPLRKPKHGEGIVYRKPRLKSAYDFLGLLYCFIVLLCVCVVPWHYMIYFPTAMARYSLFVLKVPLNTKQTNKQTSGLVSGRELRMSAVVGISPQAHTVHISSARHRFLQHAPRDRRLAGNGSTATTDAGRDRNRGVTLWDLPLR